MALCLRLLLLILLLLELLILLLLLRSGEISVGGDGKDVSLGSAFGVLHI